MLADVCRFRLLKFPSFYVERLSFIQIAGNSLFLQHTVSILLAFNQKDQVHGLAHYDSSDAELYTFVVASKTAGGFNCIEKFAVSIFTWDISRTGRYG